jgi:uncharacterized integral membrane protein
LAKLKSRVKEQETKTYVLLIFAILFIIIAWIFYMKNMN